MFIVRGITRTRKEGRREGNSSVTALILVLAAVPVPSSSQELAFLDAQVSFSTAHCTNIWQRDHFRLEDAKGQQIAADRHEYVEFDLWSGDCTTQTHRLYFTFEGVNPSPAPSLLAFEAGPDSATGAALELQCFDGRNWQAAALNIGNGRLECQLVRTAGARFLMKMRARYRPLPMQRVVAGQVRISVVVGVRWL